MGWWADIPAEMALADQPLSSVLARQLQDNLDQAYEQSTWHFTTNYYNTVESNGTNEYELLDSIPFPLPLRTQRSGAWRVVVVEFEYFFDAAGTIHAYLLPSRGTPTVDTTSGIIGGAYGSKPATTTGSWIAASITIQPTTAEILSGDGSVAVAVPMAWLWLVAKTSATSSTMSIRALRIREVVA